MVAAELVDVEVLVGEVEWLVDRLVAAELLVGAVVEMEGELELDAGVTFSGGITNMMRRAPTTSTIMSDAMNDAVLSPRVLYLLNESTGKFLLLFSFFTLPTYRDYDEILKLRRLGHSSRSHCRPPRCLSGLLQVI